MGQNNSGDDIERSWRMDSSCVPTFPVGMEVIIKLYSYYVNRNKGNCLKKFCPGTGCRLAAGTAAKEQGLKSTGAAENAFSAG
ncbi:hypothetical protein, partial [Dysosmobacter sp.]